MFTWVKELLDIYIDYRERSNSLKTEEKICESCETLKMQLGIANNEKEKLLARLLDKPEPEAKTDTSEFKPIRTLDPSWRVRRQALEAESRRQNRIMHEKLKEINSEVKTDVDGLEKELDIAAAERTATTGISSN